jgi:hypothetical protein
MTSDAELSLRGPMIRIGRDRAALLHEIDSSEAEQFQLVTSLERGFSGSKTIAGESFAIAIRAS